MTVLGYYPGCSLKGSASDYDQSVKLVASRLGFELREVPEWGCCGASAAHALDPSAALCLGADTLVRAWEAGLNEVLAPCAMCFQRLAVTLHEVKQSPALARRLGRAFETPPDFGLETMRTLDIVRWLGSLPPEKLAEQVRRPLAGMKVACYYGCMLVRPAAVTGEEQYEAPRHMEHLMALLGAETVQWPMATECCGASLALSSGQSVARLVTRIVDAARKSGANAICVACPLCHLNLDTRQDPDQVNHLPVLFISQLFAVAFGMEEADVGLDTHYVPVEPLMRCVARARLNQAGEAIA